MDMFTAPLSQFSTKSSHSGGQSRSFHLPPYSLLLYGPPIPPSCSASFKSGPEGRAQAQGRLKPQQVDRVQRSSSCHIARTARPSQGCGRISPTNGFHPFAAELKGTALLGRPVHFKVLWGPLTLGGDCFHYHINDDDSPSAANPSAARRGQAEVRAIQFLKQNAAASGEGCSTCSSCSAMPQKSHRFKRQRVWFGGIKEEKANIRAGICFTHKSWGTAGATGQTFYTSP